MVWIVQMLMLFCWCGRPFVCMIPASIWHSCPPLRLVPRARAWSTHIRLVPEATHWHAYACHTSKCYWARVAKLVFLCRFYCQSCSFLRPWDRTRKCTRGVCSGRNSARTKCITDWSDSVIVHRNQNWPMLWKVDTIHKGFSGDMCMRGKIYRWVAFERLCILKGDCNVATLRNARVLQIWMPKVYCGSPHASHTASTHDIYINMLKYCNLQRSELANEVVLGRNFKVVCYFL